MRQLLRWILQFPTLNAIATVISHEPRSPPSVRFTYPGGMEGSAWAPEPPVFELRSQDPQLLAIIYCHCTTEARLEPKHINIFCIVSNFLRFPKLFAPFPKIPSFFLISQDLGKFPKQR